MGKREVKTKLTALAKAKAAQAMEDEEWGLIWTILRVCGEANKNKRVAAKNMHDLLICNLDGKVNVIFTISFLSVFVIDPIFFLEIMFFYTC